MYPKYYKIFPFSYAFLIFEHMKDDTMPQPAPICFVYALKMFALEPINTFNF